MLKFSFALGGLLRKYNKDTYELAKVCNYPHDIINSWSCGRGVAPSPSHLIKMARAFSKTPKDVQENHLSLLYAHLLDDCNGPAAKYVNVEILSKALKIVSDASGIFPTRRRSELDLDAIRKHIWYDPVLQKSIHDLARPLKSKPIPKPQSQPEPNKPL